MLVSTKSKILTLVIEMRNVRESTIKLLEWVDEGIIDKDFVIRACLSYMSEDDVHKMCRANDILFEEFTFDEDEEAPPRGEDYD